MKVLQILPELNAGGVERGTFEVGRYLVQNGHEAVVVSHGGRLVPELEAAGIRHFTLPVHRKNLSALFQIARFRRLLREECPDILHLRSRLPGWIAWLAWRKLNHQERPRLVSTVHGFYSVNAYSAIMMRGERIIAVSESIRDCIVKNYPRTPTDNIRVVLNGINPTDYPRGFQPDPNWITTWQRDYPQLTGKRLLLLPGRITRLKGHPDFLRLVKALHTTDSSIHGVIVGNTHPRKRAYRDELQRLVQQLGLTQCVTFIGHRSDLREIMAISALVFSLSTQPESFGRTTLEALALGRPVVGYDYGGVGELLSQLFPIGRVSFGDETALLRATRQLLQEAQPGQPRAVQEPFTLEAMCRHTLEVYQELVQTPREPHERAA